MIDKYDAPPYQPKWILQLQVFLLRHTRSSFNRQTMIITTTGRKTGRRHSIPIGFIRDGDTYLALNLGGHSNWFLNALANPCVTLEVDGKKLEARVESVPANTPQEIRQVLAVFARERPDLYKSFFGMTDETPPDDKLLNIGKRVAFLRFYPLS
jgi:deazaflavin-dependent oxidoreductase (nitroreductase family)